MISGDLLREARLRAGLTQAELGRRAGKPQSVIARWERGNVQPSLETLRQLVRACGLELVFELAAYDESYVPLVDRMLALTPAQRVTRATEHARTLTRLRPAFEAARRG